MKIITTDDLVESYAKGVQRGTGFLASKFRLRGSQRTLSAFDETAGNASNWWMIPGIRRRWNRKISGDADLPYEDYLVRKYFPGRTGLRMLSLGSGSASHEMRFAGHEVFSEIRCVDLAGNLLKKAGRQALERGLKNLVFVVGDARMLNFGTDRYDAVLFHASLHHFKDIDALVGRRLLPALKENGLMIVNEYVGPNRLQYPPEQIGAVNRALKLIPREYRKRYLTGLYKKRVSGPGLLRMIIADPSEARESDKIMNTLERYLDPVEVTPYGGNILMPVLKDIAHHFMEQTPAAEKILGKLFEFEEEYLKGRDSDFVLAVFRKKT